MLDSHPADFSVPYRGPEAGSPLVSAIVPTYRDADQVPGALDSIAAQTYENVEVVVIDSSGVDWLSQLGAEMSGVTYVYQDPAGLGAARNAGIDAAEGDLLAFLDADDRWRPKKIAKQVAAVEDGAGFVYSDVYVETPGGSRQYLSALPVDDPDSHHVRFFREGGIPCTSVVVSRACLDGMGFDESLSAVEDRHMWTRLLARTECLPVRIAEPLAVYRRREASMSSDVANMYENERRVIEDLTDRFPDLAPHRESALADAEYHRGKRYLRADEPQASRRAFRAAIKMGGDIRSYPLLMSTYLPVPGNTILTALERVTMTVRRLHD